MFKWYRKYQAHRDRDESDLKLEQFVDNSLCFCGVDPIEAESLTEDVMVELNRRDSGKKVGDVIKEKLVSYLDGKGELNKLDEMFTAAKASLK